MENNILSNKISNIYDFKNSDEGIQFLKESIETILPNLKLTKSYNNGAYDGFGVVYTDNHNTIIIKLGCEKNALTHLIEVNKNKFTLYQFEKQMSNVLAFSRNNILFTLNVINKVIELLT